MHHCGCDTGLNLVLYSMYRILWDKKAFQSKTKHQTLGKSRAAGVTYGGMSKGLPDSAAKWIGSSPENRGKFTRAGKFRSRWSRWMWTPRSDSGFCFELQTSSLCSKPPKFCVHNNCIALITPYSLLLTLLSAWLSPGLCIYEVQIFPLKWWKCLGKSSGDGCMT